MPEPTTSLWLMADRLAGGTLADTIRQYRRTGVSYKATVRLLREQFGIEVSPDTVKSWVDELEHDLDPGRVA